MRLLLSLALLAPAAAERFGPPSVWEKFEHRSFVSAKSRHFQGGAGSGAVTYFYQNATLDHFGEPEPAACLNEQCEWAQRFYVDATYVEEGAATLLLQLRHHCYYYH